MKVRLKKENKSSLQEKALSLLNSSRYRATRPRVTLLKTILDQTEPFSAPKLASLLNGKNGCDNVTVYRSMPVFEELGIIERCDFSDDLAHYEVKLGHEGHHHHHIVCKSCKKVEPLEFCILEGQEKILGKLGYTDLNHRLEFSGVCPSCA
jgi:Fur family transcriptional regulator, ferric uptake regulator